MKLAHKSIHNEYFPSYLKGFETKISTRATRSQLDNKLDTKVSEKLFVGKASRLLNELPEQLRMEVEHSVFCSSLKKILLDRGLALFYSSHWFNNFNNFSYSINLLWTISTAIVNNSTRFFFFFFFFYKFANLILNFELQFWHFPW